MFKRFKLTTKAAAEGRTERCFKIGWRIFLAALAIFLIGLIVVFGNAALVWLGRDLFLRGWKLAVLVTFLVALIFLFFSASAQLESYNLNHDQNKSLPS